MSGTGPLQPADPAAAAHAAYLGRSYFTELDGVRALAVLLVISVHLVRTSYCLSWLAGARGVDIFFVLSGYLITTLALREEDRYGRVSLAAFYVRRCCRILPPYYVTLAAYCLLIFGLHFYAGGAAPFRAALPHYLLYTQEVPHYLPAAVWGDGRIGDWTFLQSWTLGIEEKFYLLWPLCAFVFWRGTPGRRPGRTAALAGLLVLLPLVLKPLGPWGGIGGGLLLCYGRLLSGCLLALLLHDPAWFARLRRLGSPRVSTAVLLVLLATHFSGPWVGAPWSDVLNALYTLAVTALLGSVLLGGGPLPALLRSRPLVAVGRLSYGMYLVHILCTCAAYRLVPASALGWLGTLLAYALAALLSFLVAWALHRAVEAPCIAWGRRLSRRLIERGARGRASPGEEITPAPHPEGRVPVPAS